MTTINNAQQRGEEYRKAIERRDFAKMAALSLERAILLGRCTICRVEPSDGEDWVCRHCRIELLRDN